MANVEISALLACLDCKVSSFKVAALLNISEHTVRHRLYEVWKPLAVEMLADAKQSGRLNDDGTVNKKKLPTTSKPDGKNKEAVNPLHGVKHGKVVKKESGKGKAKNKAKKAKQGIKDEEIDAYLMADDE